jgi:hypothetical protein
MKAQVIHQMLVASACIVVALSFSSCSTTPGTAQGRDFRTTYPTGERRPSWRAGLETRRLESISDVRVLADGSRIYTITCEAQPPLYLWDRISNQYHSPAVASQYSNFWMYTALDTKNRPFLENIHAQLQKILPPPRSQAHAKLIQKLSDAIGDAPRSAADH